jgi:hypothetical protein
LIISSSTLASVKGKPTQLSGYKAVRVHYGPLNKMIMSARINGQRANLLVDTGSNQVILNAAAAASFGSKPLQGSLSYIRQPESTVSYSRGLCAKSHSWRHAFWQHSRDAA